MDQAVKVSKRLGWVSFFNDASTEVVSRALPLMMMGSLNVSASFIGLIEGVAEMISILLKGASGWFSDRMHSRKPLVVFGYSLSFLAKIFMVTAVAPMGFAFSRWLDRTGKGLRSAPRDAMIADIATDGSTGKHFGINRFLDTLGAVTGIVLAMAVCLWMTNLGGQKISLSEFRIYAWIALPFAAIAIAILMWAVPKVPKTKPVPLKLSVRVPKNIRRYLFLIGFFSLSQSSDAFLVIRAHELGMNFFWTLFFFMLFNLLAALLALPIGKLSDRFGKMAFLAVGWLIYSLCYSAFGLATTTTEFAIFLCLYGAFYGFTDAVEKALLADRLHASERGTGFGAFQVVLGCSALPASFLMGLMITELGSKTAFLVTAAISLLSVFALPWALRKGPEPALGEHR